MMPPSTPIVVRNPNSGDGRRTRLAKELAGKRGFDVLDSESGEHLIELAAEAATRTETVLACGGDGTLNAVVKGALKADRLTDITLGVIPAGTGNDFADNIGITGVQHAFDVVESGQVRQLDLGIANGRPFLNSCVGGLTAVSSSQTSASLKRRIGVLAYVLTTFSTVQKFESLQLHVTAGPHNDPVWEGDALMLLIGNGRRFPGERRLQADMEDGLLNVVIIENAPRLEYLSRGAADKLLRRGSSHLTRLRVPHLHVVQAETPVLFSLDGQMIKETELSADCRPAAMRFFVGERYEPNPEESRA
jgi:YegS/Rv2252/BmrU family lipid kinase